MLSNWKIGDSLIYAAAATYAISLFYPWAYVTFQGDVSGFTHRGYLVLILFAFPICAVLFRKKTGFLSLASSISAAVFLVLYSLEVTQSYRGELVSYPTAGLYIAVTAASVLVVGVLINRWTAGVNAQP